MKRTTRNFIELILDSTSLYFIVIIFNSVILSLFSAFHSTGLVLSLITYGVAASVYLFTSKKTLPEFKKINANAAEFSVLLMAGLLTIVIFIRSWGIIDITHDAIVYVMPRLHLFQQLNSFLFDTYSNISNIWFNQMNFEVLSSTWNILTKSVYYAKISNQVFYFWGILATYLFLQKLEIKKWFAFTGSLIVALLPLNFFIAHTIKSDSALFACMIATLYYYGSFWKNHDYKNLMFFFLTSFLTIGIKVTALPFILLLYFILLISKRKEILHVWQNKKLLFVFVGIIASTIGLHRYVANWFYYGDPLMRVPGEFLSYNFMLAFSSIQAAIATQFSYLTTTLNVPLRVITMENVLGADGGYAFIIILLIGIPGIVYLFQKTILIRIIIFITLVHSLLIIMTRPWHPWSTRYFSILFLIIVWGGIYTIQVLHERYKAASVCLLTVSVFLITTQTIQTLLYDRSLWFEDQFTNTSIITRYDTIETFPSINKESKLIFIAHPDAPIYQYIKPENVIAFQKEVPIQQLIKIMEKDKIDYLVITNLYKELLTEVLASKNFDAIRLRNKHPDQNNTNLFKFNPL